MYDPKILYYLATEIGEINGGKMNEIILKRKEKNMNEE